MEKKHTTEKFRKENYSFDLAVDELPLEMVELLDVEFVLVVISVPKLPDIDVVVPVVWFDIAPWLLLDDVGNAVPLLPSPISNCFNKR